MKKKSEKKTKRIEESLWDAANKLRGGVEPSEYKHIVLALIFLKYVGENKWKPEKIKKIILSKKREECAPPAPPDGLFLKKIFY